MKTEKEKQLEIELLVEKIQRISKKKVVFKEETASSKEKHVIPKEEIQDTVDYLSQIQENLTSLEQTVKSTLTDLKSGKSPYLQSKEDMSDLKAWCKRIIKAIERLEEI